MSAVINRTKQHYRKALKSESLIIFALFALLMVWKGNPSLSFLAGCLAIFLPYCLFVYWIFFKKTAKNQSKMTAFYRGEAIKWLTTIALIILSFYLLPSFKVIWFFVGYFVTLLLNNLIPFVLSKRIS